MDGLQPATTILKVRTLADDIKRAQGGDFASLENTSTAPAATFIAPQKVIQINISPLQPAPPVAPAIDTGPSFNVNRAIDPHDGEATILDERPTRKRSLAGAMQVALTHWWNTTVAPLLRAPDTETTTEYSPLPPQQHAMSTAAPTAASNPPVIPHSPVAEPRPDEVSWKRISEPRERTVLPHTSDEELASYRAALQAALTDTPSTSTPKQPLKEARPVRAAEIVPERPVTVPLPQPTVVADDASARARLQKLADVPQSQPERIMRDIPFVPPAPLVTPTSPLRTYRNDALSDVRLHELSTQKIAALERDRRDTTGDPVFVMPISRRPSAPLLIALVVGIFCIGGGAYLLLHRATAPTSTTVTALSSALFSTEKEVRVPLAQERVELLTALRTARDETTLAQNEFAHLQLTAADAASTPASTDAIMRVLDPKAPALFLRTLAPTLMFGTFGSAQAPFVIVHVANHDTALAGMLKWEEYMSVDLAPFFGDPVRRTYDENALTVDRTRPAYFVDQVIQKTDVRILYDEVGDERLVYGFATPDTLIITTSHTALLALLNRL